MLDHRRAEERVAIEVGEEKLGTGLVTIHAHDAEVFGTHLLHAGMEHTAGLAYGEGQAAPGRATTGANTSHEKSLQQ